MRAWQWRPFVRVLLGAALLLHGLGKAVLPLRGADVIAPGIWMPFMTALYVVRVCPCSIAGARTPTSRRSNGSARRGSR
jgi:hypothetical protein